MPKIELAYFANKIAKATDKHVFYFDEVGNCHREHIVEAYFLGLKGIKPKENWRNYLFEQNSIYKNFDFNFVLRLYKSGKIRFKTSIVKMFDIEISMWDLAKEKGYIFSERYHDKTKLLEDVKSGVNIMKFFGSEPNDEHLYDNMTIDRFMGRIIIHCENDIDNGDENYIDHIRASFVSPFYYKNTREFVLEHKKQILKNVLEEIKYSRLVQKSELSIKDLKLTKFSILQGNEIEIRFEPKEKKQRIAKNDSNYDFEDMMFEI